MRRQLVIGWVAGTLASVAIGLVIGVRPAQAELVFAVNEGVSYRITPHETRRRYRALSEMLGIELKQYIRLVAVDDYEALAKGLAARKYDLAYVHPTHHALRAIRQHRYRTLVVTRGYTDYRAMFLLNKDAAIASPEDLHGKTFVMPAEDSITAWMARATLRELGIDPTKEKLQITRFQDGIPFMLDQGFFDVGIAASSSVVKAWQAKGGRVLMVSKPVVVKQLLASPRLPRADAERIRKILLALPASERGRAALDAIGFEGFEAPPDAASIEPTMKWLGI